MKYLSLFSGIGGFELGIIKAYESNNEHASISEKSKQEERTQGREWSTDQHGVLLHNGNRSTPLCIGYSEIDKYAIQIYQKHFANHKNYGDITKINVQELPDFDLLVGGFPCQTFSIAGKRRGFDDTRGTLFFDIARILKEKRPRNFILENVKGLLSHDNGRTFKTIITTLTELGYCVEWQVLNAKNFGVPQNRERVFIVGHLGGIPKRKVFPIIGTNEKDTRNTGEDLSYALDANYHKGTNTLEKGRRQLIKSAATRTRKYAGKAETLEIRKDNLSNTINSIPKDYYATDGIRIRRLTPLECEKLMGYPDGWTDELSDTQRYKTLGNGVVSNVVQVIIERLI